MSFLSKLLSGKKPTLSEVMELLENKEKKPAAQSAKPAQNAAPAQEVRPEPVSSEPEGEPTPIGRSWGERMPNEPNQFNFPGSYREYFEDIFRTEFAALRFVRAENIRSSKVSSYTFYEGAAKVLVIELAGEGCDIYMLRRQCRKENVPYLRFYYDHDGWWNARSYVVRRMQEALGR